MTVGTMQYNVDCQSIGGQNLAQGWFYAKVAAETAADTGYYSPISKMFCANAPDAPTVTEAQEKATRTAVTLTWTENGLNGAELKGYRIYMNDGMGGTIELKASIEDSSVRQYVATGLISDRDYRFQVTVVTAVTESARSSIKVARSCGLPSKPDPVTRKVSTSQSITVQWAAPADNGCPMTGYRVYLDRNNDGNAEESPYPGTGDESNPIDGNLNPSVLEYRQTGLNTGTIFGFRLRAYNAKGSVYSDWKYIKAAAEAATMTGIQQNIGAGSATTIVLTWSEPSTINLNGGIAVGYKVYRNAGGSTDISPSHDPTCGMTQSPAPQTCTITGLTPGETYRIQMTTINDVGENTKSTPITLKAASTPAKMPPPTNTAAGKAPSLTFSWTAPSDQGSAIFSYKGQLRLDEVPYSSVYAWTGGGTASAPYTGYTKQFQTSDSVGLIAAKRYQFRICGVNEMGQGDWSEWSSTSVAPRGVCVDAPQTPANLARSSSVVATPGTVVLSWTALNDVNMAGGDQASNVAYEMWGGAGAASTKLIRADPTAATHSQAVPPGEIWKFKLRAYNSGGQYSAFTTDIELVSAAVPGAVGSLSLVSNSPSTVNMQWTVPSTNGGTPITSYETSHDNFAGSVQSVSNTATTYTFTGRNNGALETFYVRAVNAVGAGPIVSASITVAGR